MVRKVVIPATISVRTLVLFSLSLKSCSSMLCLPRQLHECAGIGLCKTSHDEAGLPLQRTFPTFRAMRMSQYFLPTLKENPAEAQIVSHRLMLRAGLIRQTSAGIYAWLPLGFRVLKNIERIVREEQDASGAQEVLMPTIQSAELWRQSGRYDGYGQEMLRLKDRHDREMLYGPTNEEMITDLLRQS